MCREVYLVRPTEINKNGYGIYVMDSVIKFLTICTHRYIKHSTFEDTYSRFLQN